jgi:hypothetical protein
MVDGGPLVLLPVLGRIRLSTSPLSAVAKLSNLVFVLFSA